MIFSKIFLRCSNIGQKQSLKEVSLREQSPVSDGICCLRTDMGRSMIALFIVAFFFVFVAFWTGVAGCWRRSPGNITSTAILMLLACEYTSGKTRPQPNLQCNVWFPSQNLLTPSIAHSQKPYMYHFHSSFCNWNCIKVVQWLNLTYFGTYTAVTSDSRHPFCRQIMRYV